MYNDLFPLGMLFCLLGLSALLTGVAAPVTAALSLDGRKCALFLLSLLLFTALSPAAAALLPLFPAVVWAGAMRWARGALLAFAGAVLCAALLLGLFALFGGLAGVGALGGLLLSAAAPLLRYRRAALSAALGGVALSALCAALLEGLLGVVLSAPPAAYCDAAAAAALFSPAALFAWRLKRQKKNG